MSDRPVSSPPSRHPDERAPRFARTARPPWALFAAGAVLLLGLASIWIVELSVVAVVLTLIVALSLPPMAAKDGQSGDRAPRFGRTARRLARIAVLAAAVASATALTRFALTKAITGITEGGQRAASRSALWRLREVVIAEDAVRKAGLWDPDRDGVGSALLINELASNSPMRGQHQVEPPLLNYRFRQRAATPLGDAIRIASHFFIVCLPTHSGGWTAQPGVPVDDERAERRFVAYAWPADGEVDVGGVYHIDEHERMLVYDDSGKKYRGASSPPECDAALGKDRKKWRPWEGKEPRHTLPGELATKRPEP